MAGKIAETLGEFLGDPSLQLPPISDFQTAAQRILTLLDSDEGATFSLYFGNMSGQDLFAVALYPERSVVVPGRVLPADLLHDFILANEDILNDPRNSVGVWYSAAIGAIYLDVATALPGEQEVIRLGIRYNQEAVYNLARGVVIETGGMGTEPGGLPPVSERLMALGDVRRKGSEYGTDK